ncbi:MAG TPA: SMP-30/gluconolactonase/LRE family protein [Anaerolineales bacterium]|nr:SMP-30/gluconolactonase/LRE family protein [Anaerolineales bacterium]
MTPSLELLASQNDRCGECPIWDAESQRLIWNDMNASRVFAFDWKSGNAEALDNKELNAAGMAFNSTGELVFAGTGGLHLWRESGEHRTLLTHHQDEALNFNDILANPRGSLYAGTWYWGATEYEKLGKLYLIETDGSVSIQDEGIQLSNGLGLSPDEKTLYYADSTTRKIYAYTVDSASGALLDRRVFVDVPLTEGIPDGLTVDSQGYVWSAQWYGSQIVRYDPDGKVERRIQVPASQVTCMAFGGPDWTELYITTASEDWQTRYAPPGYDSSRVHIGGELYRLKLDIQGKPEYKTRFNW